MTAEIDWSQCHLVEVSPRVAGGVPVLRGTQVAANVIVENFERGLTVDEISRRFKIPRDRIRAMLFYAKSRRITRAK